MLPNVAVSGSSAELLYVSFGRIDLHWYKAQKRSSKILFYFQYILLYPATIDSRDILRLVTTQAIGPEHSMEEDRYLTFGHSSQGRLLVVSHIDRDDRIRPISAREMTRKEKSDYEQI